MGKIVQFQGKSQRVKIKKQQTWQEKETGVMWAVERIESRIVNDDEVLVLVRLVSSDGYLSESWYDEEYFRVWFRFVPTPRRRSSVKVVRNTTMQWKIAGLVVPKIPLFKR